MIFSPARLLSTITSAIRRFGLAFIFLLALGSVCLLNIWNESPFWSDYKFGVLTYYSSTGLLLSLVLQLWGEENIPRSRQIAVGTSAHSLLFLDSLWLWTLGSEGFSLSLAFGHLSAIVSLCLALFFLPFFREKDDLPSWHFALQLLTSAAVALLVGSIMTGGVCLLISSLDFLFGISVDWNWYATTFVVFELMLSLLLWMSRFPQGVNKHCHHITTSLFLTRVVRFLFLPLTGLYVLVLYAYAGKILVQWELPNGGVGWMVSVLVFGTIALTFTLYPTILQRPNSWECRVVRWLSIGVLPLLLLMSIGIYRRLSDYGVTDIRLYALLLNLWFYGVCIGLFFTRARRIHWVALSFGALFLLSSVLPLNFSNIALSMRKNRLQELWVSTPPSKEPMNQIEFDTWLQHYNNERRNEIIENLQYIKSRYGREEVAQWVKNDVSLWSYWEKNEEKNEEKKRVGEISLSAELTAPVHIPKGFEEVVYLFYIDSSWKDSTAIISFQLSDRERKNNLTHTQQEAIRDSVMVSLKELSTLNNDNLHLHSFPTVNGKHRVVFESIRGTYVPKDTSASSLDITTVYVFTRK